jgi:hypothetical protein
VKITFARVKNYKSHLDSGEIAFGSRSTVLVGQNSSGKTAFLEAFNPNTFRPLPHRRPKKDDEVFPPIPDPVSEVEYGIHLPGREIEHAMKVQAAQYHVPVMPGGDARQFICDLFNLDSISFRVSHPVNAGWNSGFPSHGLFDANVGTTTARIDINPDRQGWSVTGSGGNESLPAVIGHLLSTSIYGFRAERMNIGRCRIADTAELAPDANNLASVLLQLPRRHQAHGQYQGFVREVFPNIFWVGSRPDSTDHAVIEITMNDAANGPARAGITVPLSESGTGVSQVLALLYVVVTAEFPRIIAIDEPNSFLHPGAAKKLLTILKQFDHQYIISTHSAELIRVAEPEFLHLVEWDKTESRFQTLDRKNLEDQRRLLDEVGVSLSDVFGADSILWVEGQTEEACFPLLLNHIGLSSPAVSVVSIVATDDLAGRRPRMKLAWEVYQKLSTGNALVPPALAFALDREGRSPQNLADMVRESRGKVRFLPRRTYENYLIDDDAISSVLTAALGKPVLTETIRDWIAAHRDSRTYLDKPLVEGLAWVTVVNAPELLYDMFNLVTDAKVEYQKTRHSVALTEWLLANKPETLDELQNFVRTLIEQ